MVKLDENVKQIFAELRKTSEDRTEFFRLLELVSVDAQNSSGVSLLGKAGEYNDADMVRLLLQKGADIEGGEGKKKKGLITPFVIATRQGHVEIMKILIDAGAILQPSCISEHILFSAVLSGNTAAVELVLTSGLKTYLSRDGVLCRAAACLRRPTQMQEMLKFLLSRGVGDVAAVDDTGCTALQCVAHNHGDGLDVTGALAALLDHGAAIDQLSRDGKSALHHAAGIGNKQSVDFLLSRGANVTIADSNGQTALHNIGAYPSPPIAVALLTHGARVDAVDKQGTPPLHCIVRRCGCLYGNREAKDAARELLQAGADVNATDKDGDAALHYWAKHCFAAEAAQLLIDHGADVALQNSAGQRPSDVARDYTTRTFLAAEEAQRNNHRYKRPRLEDLQSPAAIAPGAEDATSAAAEQEEQEEEEDESEDDSEDEEEDD
jgi:ankyrin repeat protein